MEIQQPAMVFPEPHGQEKGNGMLKHELKPSFAGWGMAAHILWKYPGWNLPVGRPWWKGAMEIDCVEIHRGFVPGTIGSVTEMHGTYYHAHWGFGSFFESKVAGEMAEFIGRYDEKRDGLWIALRNKRVEGSIVIDGIHAREEGAHLRWFIVSDAFRGRGIGGRLIRRALEFCRQKAYERVYLWTFEGLHPARHLYEKSGFQLTEEHPGTQWGREVLEQRFELRIQ